MNEIEKLKEDIAFLQKIEPLMSEFEAAREVKHEDPDRWFNAKQAFEVERTYWRQIGEYLAATNANINASVANADGKGFDTNQSEGK